MRFKLRSHGGSAILDDLTLEGSYSAFIFTNLPLDALIVRYPLRNLISHLLLSLLKISRAHSYHPAKLSNMPPDAVRIMPLKPVIQGSNLLTDNLPIAIKCAIKPYTALLRQQCRLPLFIVEGDGLAAQGKVQPLRLPPHMGFCHTPWQRTQRRPPIAATEIRGGSGRWEI
jgi:hypothetical protein